MKTSSPLSPSLNPGQWRSSISNWMAFGLSSGVGYAIAKSITQKVQKGIQLRLMRFKSSNAKINTNSVYSVFWNNDLMWNVAMIGATAVVAIAAGSSSSSSGVVGDVVSLLNGALPLFCCHLITTQNQRFYQQRKSDGDESGDDSDRNDQCDSQSEEQGDVATQDNGTHNTDIKESARADHSTQNIDLNTVNTQQNPNQNVNADIATQADINESITRRSRSNSILTQTSVVKAVPILLISKIKGITYYY